MRRALCLLTLALLSPLAHATDGVIEISQAKVLASGGHFPYVISASGSYRLTSNLDVTNDPGSATVVQDRTAIQVTASYVTIDLNGFAILGSTTCSGGPPVTACTPQASPGNGYGFSIQGEGVRVTNGTIKGMGNHGLSWNGNFNQFDHLRVIGNGASGLSAPAVATAVITNCIVARNFSSGITINSGGLIVENQVYGNGNGGISADRSELVRNIVLNNAGGLGGTGSAALENLVYGNSAGISGSLAIGNLSSTNTGRGVYLNGSGGVAAFNSSTANAGGFGYGIQSTVGGGAIFGNGVYGNAQVGLSLMTGATADAFSSNVLDNNNASAGQSVGGVQMGTNICKGTTTCP